MVFSDKQKLVLRHARGGPTWCCALGAIRSGKTWAVGLSFAAYLATRTEPNDHVIVAVSVEVAWRNVVSDLIHHVKRIGGHAELNRQFGTRLLVTFPGNPTQDVWVIGAADERSRQRIQGATIAGAIADEITVLPQPSWEFLLGRLTLPYSRGWLSGNPEGPAHWAKRHIVDRLDEIDGMQVLFYLRDNPSLSTEIIERLERSYTGFQHRRLIEGIWAAASGACWPKWQTVDQDPPKDFTRLTLGLDWATSGVLGVLAVRSPRDMDKAVVTHELRRDGGKEGLLTDAEFAKRVAAWCEGEVGSSPQGALIVHDPSMPTDAERALRYYGFRLHAGRNDVAPGIMRTGSVLGEGRLLIHERCRHLRDEMASYVWDEKKALIGEDAPVKAADHLCDALRYVVYTLWKLAPVGPMTRPMPMSIRLKDF